MTTRCISAGHLLGGRVAYAQPASGFRSGIEPVLLAAAIPARSGEHVLEGGTGAGAGLLCLAERVRGVRGVGVDIDPAMVRLARDNARANDRPDLCFLAADLAAVPLAAQPGAGRFDHAFANPPYHAPGGSVSPDATRDRAKRAPADVMQVWAGALAGGLRHHGTLSFIVPAHLLPATLAACADHGCGSAAVLPLWPKAGRAGKLVMVRAVKGGRGPFRLLPGLVLHQADGRFTPAADAILRDGAELGFG